METDDQSGEVKLRPLGGVNERLSPIDLPPSEFSELKGLFPRQNGLQERIWSAGFLEKFPDPVISISPTYNSSNHILIQTTKKRYLATLDELLGRDTYDSDLTPATSSPGGSILEEETMSLAVIIGKKSAGTTGKIVGTSFGNRDLSDIHVNDGGIVTALASNVFTLVAGTYRIESLCCFCNAVTLGAQQLFIHRLYNSTNSDYLFKVTGVVSAASTAARASTPARINDIVTNIWSHHIGTVTLDSSCDIALQSKTNTITVTDGAAPVEGKPTNLGEVEVYSIVKILKTA